MRKNAALIAFVTIALAFVGVSSLPWKPSGGSPGKEQQSNKTKKDGNTAEKKAEESDACEQIRGRIQPFLTVAAGQDWRLADPCHGSVAGVKLAGPDLKFLIATAPNPITTHLPLMFDRMIEVIQRGARDEGYLYDSSWFPWDTTGKDYSSFSDQRDAEQAQKMKQRQPGVLTFRRDITKTQSDGYKDGLIVFVVAEQPTRGIDAQEFENALAWIEALGALTPDRGLGMLAPTFSGSLPSLSLALGSTRLAKFSAQSKIEIYSGTTSSVENIAWFRDRLTSAKLGRFQTAMESDSRMIQLFCTYIEIQGYRLDRIAFLSEDETAFGEEANQNKLQSCSASPIHLSYPRDIATLRSAYQEQSILTAKAPSTGTTPSTSLRGDLSEPENSEHDTVRSYSGQLAPLAQESVLVAITDILRAQHIEFVVLRSTNTLDQIFLAQFLRRVYPEARVILDGSDLLFRRGGEGASLRGVLTLSPYPLYTWQEDWTPIVQGGHRNTLPVFGEDIIQGAYVAIRALLGPGVTGNHVPPAWALPSHEADKLQAAATWISVIGHHQFWPVAVLNEQTLGGRDVTSHDNANAGAPDRSAVSLLDQQEPSQKDRSGPLQLQGGLQFLLIAIILWGMAHLEWCRKGSVVPSISSFKLSYFAPNPKKQHAALIAMGSVILALAAVVTAFATGLMTWSLHGWAAIIELLWFAALLVLALTACRENFALDTVACDPAGCGADPQWRVRVVAVAVGCFALFVILFSYMTYLSGKLLPANAIPAYWRSAHLMSGVSPLLPQILLLGGLYLWFWFALRGVGLFGDDRPLLPKKDDLPHLDGIPMWPMFSREGAEDPVEEVALPWGKEYLWTLLVTLLAALGIFGLALEGVVVRTLGERPFGVTMFVWLSICMAMVLADSAQLWRTWRHLRALLTYLDRVPLRRTLAALKGLSWGSVWSIGGNTLSERYRLISRQFESLRHLQNRLSVWVPDKTSPEKQSEELGRKKRVLKQIELCYEQGIAFAKWYVSLGDEPVSDLKEMHGFQEKMAETVAVVLTDVLQPAWQHESESLIVRKDAGHGKEAEADAGSKFDTSPVAPHVLAAEELVVLCYLGFIQNVLGRIRSIIMGSLFLFAATTFAVASYPFDPMPRLGGAFLVIFVITGGVVIVVYAQMNRDTTLSHITNTNPGELGSHFWVQLITFGIGPLLGLLTTLFPSITDFVTSWLQPSVQALK